MACCPISGNSAHRPLARRVHTGDARSGRCGVGTESTRPSPSPSGWKARCSMRTASSHRRQLGFQSSLKVHFSRGIMIFFEFFRYLKRPFFEGNYDFFEFFRYTTLTGLTSKFTPSLNEARLAANLQISPWMLSKFSWAASNIRKFFGFSEFA